MTKAAFNQIAEGLNEAAVIVQRAQELYVQAGNPIELWGLEDYPVRAHFLIVAAQAKDDLPERTLLH